MGNTKRDIWAGWISDGLAIMNTIGPRLQDSRDRETFDAAKRTVRMLGLEWLVLARDCIASEFKIDVRANDADDRYLDDPLYWKDVSERINADMSFVIGTLKNGRLYAEGHWELVKEHHRYAVRLLDDAIQNGQRVFGRLPVEA